MKIELKMQTTKKKGVTESKVNFSFKISPNLIIALMWFLL